MPVVLQWLFVVAVFVALGVVLIRGSQPALTPEQIVQQDSYQGEQEARRIFNLNSARKEAIELTRSVTELPADDTQTDRQSSESVASVTKAEPAADISATVAVNADDENAKATLRSAEVPAVAISAEEPAVEPQATVITAEPEPAGQPMVVPAGETDVVTDNSPKMLPIYAIVGPQIRIYESPDESAPAVATVAADNTVTLFSTEGAWAEVAANDGSGVTGYVRRSQITEIAQ
ncbi:MAG: hypothetical protein AAF404_19265 [Pseudomonadota bacterium]